MRYLELSELSQLNALLADVQSDDGSKIYGRIECYSCKAAGQDKKLLRKLAQKYPDGLFDDFSREYSMDESTGNIPSSPGGPGIWSSSTAEATKNGMPLKLFYFLVSTMNLMFPDYDFSDISPSTFERKNPVNNVINHVNTTLFNTGANKNYDQFTEFTRTMWDCLDRAIEMHEAEIFSFIPDSDSEIDDPFTERGVVYNRDDHDASLIFSWSMNYFFWNKKLKRLLVLQLKCSSPLDYDSEYPFSPRSLTPL